jgi:serine/threonine protein phosphatase 1
MFRRFRSIFSKRAASPAVGAVPDGCRIYAVGDIHGRLDLLDLLLVQIEQDDAERGLADTQVIFLGDLIDRGPDSAQVVERLLDLSRRSERVRLLLGNHEEVFLKALAGEKGALPFFARIGGKETILSYGITEAQYGASDYDTLGDMLRERVPQSHIDFLNSFEDLIEIGDYAFVHAGIRPGVPLAEQSPGALRWIREEFLGHHGPLEKIVVHGHTIADEVEEFGWRIGIDTGAFASGKLTAMAFEGTARWVLQTGGKETSL